MSRYRAALEAAVGATRSRSVSQQASDTFDTAGDSRASSNAGAFATFDTGRGRRVSENRDARGKASDTFDTGRGSRVLQNAPDPTALGERLAMAQGGAPEVFADAFARLQLQRPVGIDEATWRRAVDDAGRFLDGWGEMAEAFAWTPGDLFDVPRDGRGGLVWALHAEAVRALGPEHAITTSGRVFDRTDRAIWASVAAWNAAQSARTSSLDPTR